MTKRHPLSTQHPLNIPGHIDQHTLTGHLRMMLGQPGGRGRQRPRTQNSGQSTTPMTGTRERKTFGKGLLARGGTHRLQRLLQIGFGTDRRQRPTLGPTTGIRRIGGVLTQPPPLRTQRLGRTPAPTPHPLRAPMPVHGQGTQHLTQFGIDLATVRRPRERRGKHITGKAVHGPQGARGLVVEQIGSQPAPSFQQHHPRRCPHTTRNPLLCLSGVPNTTDNTDHYRPGAEPAQDQHPRGGLQW